MASIERMFKDIKAAMSGKDLEETKKKSTVKTAAKKDDGYKSKVTDQAKTDAAFYVAHEAQLSKDFKDALDGKPLSSDLKKALQVLLDNKGFREMIGCQDGVLPSPDEWTLDYEFVTEGGKECTNSAINLIRGGNTIEQIKELFGIKLKIYKVRKLDNTRLGDVTGEESYYKEVTRRVQSEFYKKKEEADSGAKAS